MLSSDVLPPDSMFSGKKTSRESSPELRYRPRDRAEEYADSRGENRETATPNVNSGTDPATPWGQITAKPARLLHASVSHRILDYQL
jgi:hypothetical protein